MKTSVKIYTTQYCPYCRVAKNLLNKLKISFEEINLTNQINELEILKQKTNFQTVPQIFIHEEFIGGYQELLAIYQNGNLEKKLETTH